MEKNTPTQNTRRASDTKMKYAEDEPKTEKKNYLNDLRKLVIRGGATENGLA